jgi:hypothetical protein
MGNFCCKPKNECIEDLPTKDLRTPEELKEAEKQYDKLESDALEQHRIIQKYLREDELEYAKILREYRKLNNVHIITDREIIRKAENIRVRQSIRW